MKVELFDVFDEKVVHIYEGISSFTLMGQSIMLERSDGSYAFEDRDDYCLLKLIEKD